ncbi:hypothetical protein HMPREF3202_00853 [Prevotella bivia]|uniref:Uncharacterized protein n=1 Tax=Prevotella bivia TaxID=28125 RepID=A0A137SYW5_9BACT|nr:hypothetical protein HMPREF3202_00853 [Prevotella bivia]
MQGVEKQIVKQVFFRILSDVSCKNISFSFPFRLKVKKNHIGKSFCL